MADVKENQLTVKSAQYLRGIYVDGSSVLVRNIQDTIANTIITIDCNEKKEEGRYAANKWLNSPYNNIGVLEVFRYSPDWIVQKMYGINVNSPVFIRCFYDGNTWTSWRQI